jgi:hypothetical protein
MNEIMKSNQEVAAREADLIGNAAQEDAGFEKLLKFKKGTYECDNAEVPYGTEYTAHCVGWTKAWIKFIDSKVVERKMYRVAEGKRVPDREELDDQDMNEWPKGPDGKTPSDPWVYQHLLPMEDKNGDLVVFATSSIGGKRAVADLCKSYARRVNRTGHSDSPIIKLSAAVMPTKSWGDVPRPHFEIIGWDEHREAVRVVKGPDTLLDEMNDEIPF